MRWSRETCQQEPGDKDEAGLHRMHAVKDYHMLELLMGGSILQLQIL